MPEPVEIASGLRFPEGPVVLPDGDLLVVDIADQLAALDAYEECDPPSPLFKRERTTAWRPDGSLLAVWVYRYCLSVVDAEPIAGGDYALHRQRASGCSDRPE